MPSLTNLELVPTGSFNHWVSYDFDEQADLLRGWNQDYLQMSSGRFNGYVSDIKFKDVHLFLEYTNQALFQHGQLGNDVIAIGVPLAANNHGVFCGTPSTSDCIHVFSGGNGFEFFSPNGLVMAGISVNRTALFEMLMPEEQAAIQRNCGQAHIFTMSSARLDGIRKFISEIFQTVQAMPDLLQNDLYIKSLRTTILAFLADNLIHGNDDVGIQLSTSRCWHIVAESRELALTQSENAISVADLCQHFGISRRSLQYCFHNMLATNPVAYLRAERLNAVRHMLKDANSVTEAATHWGFWHFGHFSQEYKKMFGELPSTTFKRLHSLN
ncbi:helix-turn-helix domain-containing protein [Sulfuriferula nivalis]|uniref:AraC family transcriptional regulator n=1 Tax=Sulfuriferula nivalis TaxID=2675298 RepID=A0A809RGE8_9PROT|nr:helix-turn-helix domain-containing protein [Sulfuriferula nivalis]BBP00716.1 AraC family transcriptional regulator [Sulfuriferula nivalis]